jgi:hypothetical protein
MLNPDLNIGEVHSRVKVVGMGVGIRLGVQHRIVLVRMIDREGLVYSLIRMEGEHLYHRTIDSGKSRYGRRGSDDVAK